MNTRGKGSESQNFMKIGGMKEAWKCLAQWCVEQRGVRLKLGPPLSQRQIDDLPKAIALALHRYKLPFKPEDFVVPSSYREFLAQHSFARIEYNDEDGPWSTYEPFNIFPRKNLFGVILLNRRALR